MNMNKQKKSVFYIFRTARKPLLESYHKNNSHNTFLYGFTELQKMGYMTFFSDLAYHPINLVRYILHPLEFIFSFLLNYQIGFKLHQALILWPMYRKYDVIVTTQDSAGLPFLLLKKLHLISNRIIYISNGLANSFTNVRSSACLSFVIYLLQSADALVCYSKKEQEIIEKYTNRQVIFIPLGVDSLYFTPTKKRSAAAYSYNILAAGKDYFRDYKTLCAAVSGTSLKVVIACGPENIKGISIPKNVTVKYNAAPSEMKKLYSQARIVVIPMKNTDKTQGQVVFMEAAAMNKYIIASNISGLTHAYDLQQYPYITLVKPESSKALKNAINKIISSHTRPSLLKTQSFRDSISVHTYAKKLEEVIRQV